MDETKQQAIPGAFGPVEKKADKAAEVRAELEDVKVRYDKATEDLFATMMEKGAARVWARGMVFSIEQGEPKLKVRKGNE